MSKPPLKRIYFDSNILRNWPNSSNELWNVFNSAAWLKTEICFPQVVESELEGQFVREVQKSFADIEANFKQLNKRCRNIITLDIHGKESSEAELRTAFQHRSNELKTLFNITTIPLTKIDLAILVDMAINRVVPFEEVALGKDRNGVVGLQDAAILFSIIEHMKDAKDHRCAIISNDAIFYHKDARSLMEKVGVKLEGFRSLGALWDEMFDHILPFVRDPWLAEMKQIEHDLNADKTELTKQVVGFLNATEFSLNLWRRAKELKGFSIEDFAFVKTDLPDVKFRPPNVAVYTREESSSLKISALAHTEMQAIVERANWSSLFGDPVPGPEVTPILEDATLSETLNVSLIGTVHNGVIGSFEVTAVEPYKT